MWGVRAWYVGGVGWQSGSEARHLLAHDSMPKWAYSMATRFVAFILICSKLLVGNLGVYMCRTCHPVHVWGVGAWGHKRV